MMQIELTGCTGAGKSTLASGIRRACRDQGTDFLLSHDFVLKQIRLSWIKSNWARTLLLDLCSLSVCLATWRNNLELYVFAIQNIFRLPIARFEKLNLARNVLKKIGIYEIIRRRGSDQQIVLVDEGTLHAAHNLFVHVSAKADPGALATFVKLAPLPDVAVYVTQSESVLIQRTMQRGHKRILDRSPAKVELFIKRAVDIFDKLIQELVLQRGMLVVESQRSIVVAQSHQNDPSVAVALEVIRAGMDAILVDNSTHTRT
jgi:thymidylate kinase